MRIILTGPKGAGKTTLGDEIARLLGIPFIETDTVIENIYNGEHAGSASCREIYSLHGESAFRELEKQAVQSIQNEDWCLISSGGGTFYDPLNRALLRKNSIIVLLRAPDPFLWSRMKQKGLPPFLLGDDGFERFKERNLRLYDLVEPLCDIVFDIETKTDGSLRDKLADEISAFFMLGMNSPNTFGEIIRVTTFGESHGKAVGAVLDGLLPGVPVSEDDIQFELNRRRPGQSRISTQRNEKDKIHILSGVFEGKTTGTPICMLVYNEDQDSSKYDSLRDVFRPGHADFTFWKKYGLRDHRGGGRSSGRETVGRVASGALAKSALKTMGIEIFAFSEVIAGVKGEVEDFTVIENNSVRAADPGKAAEMESAILELQKAGNSAGGVVKCVIKNCPAGIGDPVFFKLDARLAAAFFSVGAVKGVEIGAGFAASCMGGAENNDPMSGGGFLANNAGGILGGISTGEDIVLRAAVKPTPSVVQEQQTCDIYGNDTMISIRGRHDPCIVPRIVPVIESMAALVILDALRMQEKIRRRDEP
jgi:chorismate synthase